jgi:hypothetical protein
LELAAGRTLVTAGPGVELSDEPPPALLHPQITATERSAVVTTQAVFLMVRPPFSKPATLVESNVLKNVFSAEGSRPTDEKHRRAVNSMSMKIIAFELGSRGELQPAGYFYCDLSRTGCQVEKVIFYTNLQQFTGIQGSRPADPNFT